MTTPVDYSRALHARLRDIEAEIRDLRQWVEAEVETETARHYVGTKVETTEHPHVVKVEGILGGEPVIPGHRLPVRHVIQSLRVGMSPAEYAEKYQLTYAQVYDAIAYYYDHAEEIERYIQENTIEYVLEASGLSLGEKGFVQER